MNQVFCSKCGKKNPVDSKFCSYCGAVIPSMDTDMNSIKSVICSNCGAKNPEGSKFCNMCRTDLYQRDNVQNNLQKTRERFAPSPVIIGIGIIIIILMYCVPIVTLPTSGSITLANYATTCTSGSFLNSALYACNRSQYLLIFYGGWIFAAILILIGVLNKEKK